MAYQYESFQSSLPASVPAGWNDPPPVASGHPSSGATSRLSQLRRRPVDPSITGPSYGMGGHHQGYGAQAAPGPYGAPSAAPTGPYGAPSAAPAGPYGAPAHQQVPQGHQQAPQGYPGYPMANQSQPDAYGSVHMQQSSQAYPPSQVPSQIPNQMPHHSQVAPFQPPASAPVPTSVQQGMPPQQYNMPPAATSAPYAQQPSPVISQQPGAGPQGVPPQQQQYNNASAIPNNTPYYPAQQQATEQPMVSATPQAASMPSAQHRAIYDAFAVNTVPQGLKTDPFVVRPQSSAPSVSIPTVASHAAWTVSAQNLTPQTPATPPVQQPLESNPHSLIFAPPGSIGEAQPGVAQSSPVDPNAYNRLPMKAAGDVSLTGPQLVMFLMKATTRLPQAKCEGVQLRLNQLQEFIQQGRLSDPCIKKLNFVVDAIDRGLLDDATTYFDQLYAQFPQEMGTWGQGVRLLIGELRGPASRVGSAGPHIRTQ